MEKVQIIKHKTDELYIHFIKRGYVVGDTLAGSAIFKGNEANFFLKETNLKDEWIAIDKLLKK